jgi:hypothetical protein
MTNWEKGHYINYKYAHLILRGWATVCMINNALTNVDDFA